MALKFVSGEKVKKRHLVVVLYGPPSVGKTSFALTASRPVLLDADRGVHRSPNRAGKTIVEVNTWDDIANPEPADFVDHDTVIPDTAGGVIDKIIANIIRSDPKRGAGGTLDLKGYGILKGIFSGWLERLRQCSVDVVLLAHGAEEQRGDDMVDRIFAAGSSKQEIYQQADLIGRMYVEPDGSRWLSFDPTAGSFGKNCGLEKRPIKNPLAAPDQLAEIINEARIRINESIRDDQDEIARIQNLQKGIAGLDTPEKATEATLRMNDPQAPAADIDKRLLWEHCKRKGFFWSKEHSAFFASEAAAEAANQAPPADPQPTQPASAAAPEPASPPADPQAAALATTATGTDPFPERAAAKQQADAEQPEIF